MSNKKKVSKEEEKSQEQPSILHYLIVLGILVGGLFVFAFVFEFFADSTGPQLDRNATPEESYRYEFVRSNATYNIELSAPIEDINRYNFTIEPTRLEVLNTQSFTFSFDTYEGSDNGQVSMSAIKLRRFLDRVYFFNFDSNESFTTTDTFTCDNSTPQHRVVEFKPRADVSGVFSEDNGCFVVKSTQPNLMPFVIDDLLVSIMEEYE